MERLVGFLVTDEHAKIDPQRTISLIGFLKNGWVLLIIGMIASFLPQMLSDGKKICYNCERIDYDNDEEGLKLL